LRWKRLALSRRVCGILKTSKPKYGELVQTEKKLGDEAEKLLKEAVAEYKKLHGKQR